MVGLVKPVAGSVYEVTAESGTGTVRGKVDGVSAEQMTARQRFQAIKEKKRGERANARVGARRRHGRRAGQVTRGKRRYT